MNDATSRHYGLRRRMPRVDLEYDLETYGTVKTVRLPWVRA